MALSNFARRMTQTSVEAHPNTDAASSSSSPPPVHDEKRSIDTDVEGGAPKRRMSRIDGKDDHPSDTDSTISIGAQIEMEKDNAIKYRTCSWQKVRFLCSSLAHVPQPCLHQGGMCYRAPPSINQMNLIIITRLHSCSSLSIFAWLSCHSRGRTRFSALCQD